MQVKVTMGHEVFTVTLQDNPTSRNLVSQLPLRLSAEDYSNNEKISYLPRKLTEQSSGPLSGESISDLCYYAPWGILAFFHSSYRYSKGLIRLGRLDAAPGPLLQRGELLLRIEAVRKALCLFESGRPHHISYI